MNDKQRTATSEEGRSLTGVLVLVWYILQTHVAAIQKQCSAVVGMFYCGLAPLVSIIGANNLDLA